MEICVPTLDEDGRAGNWRSSNNPERTMLNQFKSAKKAYAQHGDQQRMRLVDLRVALTRAIKEKLEARKYWDQDRLKDAQRTAGSRTDNTANALDKDAARVHSLRTTRWSPRSAAGCSQAAARWN